MADRRRMALVLHIISPCVRPKRVHKQSILIQSLRAFRRARLGADVLFGILSKTIFYKANTFWNEFQDIHYVMMPEGTKPDAAHQDPRSVRLQHYADILSKTCFDKNHTCLNEFQDIHHATMPEGTKPDAVHQDPLSIRFQ